MRSRVEGLEEADLQEVWFRVNQEVLKRILRVLPERHPSRRYVAGLESLYKKVEIQLSQSHSHSDERELPERVNDILSRLKDAAGHRLKASDARSIQPKALLDNFQHTIQCLFPDCFPSPDPQYKYCAIAYWRKGRKKREEGPTAT
ncbi:interleukin-34 [Aplochiton taeniatus]